MGAKPVGGFVSSPQKGLDRSTREESDAATDIHERWTAQEEEGEEGDCEGDEDE